MSRGLRCSITTAREGVVNCPLPTEFFDMVADTADAISSDLQDLEIALAGCMERLKEVERDVVQRSVRNRRHYQHGGC